MRKFWKKGKRGQLAAAAAALLAALYFLLLAPPPGASAGALVEVPEGASLPAVANILYADRALAHPFVFSLIVRALGGSASLNAGPYRIVYPEDALTLAWRIIHADYGIKPIRITFVEGTDVGQMAALVAKNFPFISAEDFEALAAPQEGYLFPDTYVFLPGASATDIVNALSSNFDTRVASITPAIHSSGHSFAQVVTMASLVEREANNPIDRRIIAGILWHRLALGMALQVDVDPDTYKTPGLPAAPIDNPGLDSLLASAEPTKTPYLYYLTGKDGKMHYASTFAQHLANEKKYL